MDLLDMFTLIIALIGVAIAWFKAPREAMSHDAGAAESYATAAKTYSEELVKLRLSALKEREMLQKQIDDINEQLAHCLLELERCRNMKSVLYLWGEELSARIVELGGQPIPFPMEEDKR